MTPSHTPIAIVPSFVFSVLRPLPLSPLQLFLSAVMRRIVRHHPRIFERLGPYAGKRYGLEPSDLPLAFILDTAPNSPRVMAVRTLPKRLDARISGPLRALIGMVDGSYDGDALFFARTIVVEGDMEAVLALRNAIDDAGVDVLHEGAALLGPLGQLGEAFLRSRGRGMPHGEPARSGREAKEFTSWN